MSDHDEDEPLPAKEPAIPQHLHGASEWENFVYRVWLHYAPPEVAARIAFESGREAEPEPPRERDVRSEINALYHEHFPDNGKEWDQTQTPSKDHDFSR